MKISEMNTHQKAMYYLMDEITCEMIGGAENTMEDYAPETEEYKDAEAFLNQGHDKLAAYFYAHVMNRCKSGSYASHARFAGSEFLKERIERRLQKWGY
jgi:hypothetical protein